jgi:hypothetical protein
VVMTPSSSSVLLGFFINYIVTIEIVAYLLWGELEMYFSHCNVDDGLGGAQEWSS